MRKYAKTAESQEETEKSSDRTDRLTKEEIYSLVQPRSTGEEIKLNKALGGSDCKKGRKKAWSFDSLRDLVRQGVYGGGDEASLKKEKLAEEVRLRKAQADRASIDVDAARKLTLPADEVSEYGRRLGAEIKTQLQSVGASIAVQAANLSNPREVQALIDARIQAVLGVLAEWRWDPESFRASQSLNSDEDDLEEEAE